MAKTGLSKSYYALYTYDSTEDEVTYSGGGVLGKAVNAEIEVEAGDQNVFYANNGPAERDSTFGGGTLTITNDSLELTPLMAILGLELASDGTLHFPADLAAPHVAYATIGRHLVGNSPKYRAIILLKVQFNVPADSLATQEETIEFSGHELTAVIMRNDATPSEWKVIKDFDTETAADTFIKTFLSIT